MNPAIRLLEDLEHRLEPLELELDSVALLTRRLDDVEHHPDAARSCLPSPDAATHGLCNLSSGMLVTTLCQHCRWEDPMLRTHLPPNMSWRVRPDFLLSELETLHGQLSDWLLGPATLEGCRTALARAHRMHDLHDGTTELARSVQHRAGLLLATELLTELEAELLEPVLAVQLLLERYRAGLPAPQLLDAMMIDSETGELLEPSPEARSALTRPGWVLLPGVLKPVRDEEAEHLEIHALMLASQVGAACLVSRVVYERLRQLASLGSFLNASTVHEASEVMEERPAPELLEAFAVLYRPRGGGAFTTVPEALEAARLL